MGGGVRARGGVLSKDGIRICYPGSVYLCRIHSNKKRKHCKRRGRLPEATRSFLFRNGSAFTHGAAHHYAQWRLK